MPAIRYVFLAVCGLLLLQACAETPTKMVTPAEPEPRPAPEIDLNLPDHGTPAPAYKPEPAVDATFLEKGIAALVDGDYREAVNYFRRYQRLESSPGVDWEASIAVAYVKMMPDSPYYNWRASMDSYRRLMRVQPTGIPLHKTVLMMRDSLEIFVDLHLQIDEHQRENKQLSENLEKREDALKRLRELTLGQKGG